MSKTISLQKFIGNMYFESLVLGLVIGTLAAAIEWKINGYLSGGSGGQELIVLTNCLCCLLWFIAARLNRRQVPYLTLKGEELASDATRLGFATLFPVYWVVMSFVTKLDLVVHGIILTSGIYWIGLTFIACRFLQSKAKYVQD